MVDPRKIELQEGALTFARISELDDEPVQGAFDAAHLKEIHRRIFQDLPHHAPGEYRPDAPAHIKARALEGSGHRYHVHYAPRSQVDAGIGQVLAELGGPDRLRGLNAEQFSQRMARLYADLDHLHPFKEGNSRTLRAFTEQLAREAGYEMGWSAANIDASSRDRLYVARDKEVMQRAFPGLDQDRAMATDSRAEYEAYVRFVAPFSRADTLQQLIQESVHRTQDLAAEKAPREGVPASPRDAAAHMPPTGRQPPVRLSALQSGGRYAYRQAIAPLSAPGWSAEQERRATGLETVRRTAVGASLTFAEFGCEAIHKAGNAAKVDWRRVEDAAMAQSLQNDLQPASQVYQAIAAASPAAVTESQKSALRDRVDRLASGLEAGPRHAADAGPSPAG